MTARRCRVLIIEDEPELREGLCALLEEEGYEITAASNGRRALDLLRQGPLPDLAVLDLMMPEMNGWEFRRHQLADPALASLPIIILSGAPDGRREARALGVADFAAKPIGVRPLLDMIANRIGAGPA